VAVNKAANVAVNAAQRPVKKAASAEQAAEEAATNSARTATLLDEQAQMKREVGYVPRLAQRLDSLMKSAKVVADRDKYALKVGSAISKGIEQVKAGKPLHSAPQLENNVELGESAEYAPPMTDVNGEVQREAQAYASQQEYSSERETAATEYQQETAAGAESVEQAQATALAQQNARDQAAEQAAMQAEIAKVKHSYTDQLMESKEAAKAKALSTLKTFAADLKAKHAAVAQPKPREAGKREVPAQPKQVAKAEPAVQKQASDEAAAKAKTRATLNSWRQKAGTAELTKKTPEKTGQSDKKSEAAASEKETTPVAKVKKAKKVKKVKKAKKAKTVQKAKKASEAKKSHQAQHILQAQEEEQRQAIMQAGVERALVDTSKKITNVNKITGVELKREKAYFADKQKQDVKAVTQNPKDTAKVKQLKAADLKAEQNFAVERKRLVKKVAGDQQELKDMKKVSLAVSEEKKGLRKTAVLAQELEKAAEGLRSNVQGHLRDWMHPSDHVARITTDLGETIDLNKPETVDVSPEVAKLEQAKEQDVKHDLGEYKVLEKAAAAAASLVIDSAKTSLKENRLAAMQNEDAERIAAPGILEMDKLVNAGHVMERTMMREANQEVQANALAKKLSVRPVKHHAPKTVSHLKKAGAAVVVQETKPKEFDDEDQDLGEGADVDEYAHARRPALSKLKQEQFALVNAQTKLNNAMRGRKQVEDGLAKKLAKKDKIAVKSAKLDVQAHKKAYEADAGQAIKKTTSIDKFIFQESKAEKGERKRFAEMKRDEDAAVHDEFIATQSAQKTVSRFKSFLNQGTGMLNSIHDPAMQAIVKQQTAQNVATHEGGTDQQQHKPPAAAAAAAAAEAKVKRVATQKAAQTEKAAQRAAQQNALKPQGKSSEARPAEGTKTTSVNTERSDTDKKSKAKVPEKKMAKSKKKSTATAKKETHVSTASKNNGW